MKKMISKSSLLFLASKRNPCLCFKCSLSLKNNIDCGYTLIEALVTVIVLGLVIAGSVSGFNFVIDSTTRNRALATANAEVETDKARIFDLAEVYTACTTPAGSASDSASCSITERNSYYYTPDDEENNLPVFFDRCADSNDSTHITHNFIEAINALSQPTNGVTRSTAVRVDPGNADSHLVNVQWTLNDFNITRSINVYPRVSQWCP